MHALLSRRMDWVEEPQIRVAVGYKSKQLLCLPNGEDEEVLC